MCERTIVLAPNLTTPKSKNRKKSMAGVGIRETPYAIISPMTPGERTKIHACDQPPPTMRLLFISRVTLELTHRKDSIELDIVAWKLSLPALQFANPPLILVLRSAYNLNNFARAETQIPLRLC